MPLELALKCAHYVRDREPNDAVWGELIRVRNHVLYNYGTDTATGPEQRDTDAGSGAGVS